ncbi:MAG: ABC transporter permease [Deltaproteobacteria bacterium]|nr:ABC transporter permease [Deltaproteobacteria bacterium]
MFLYLYNLISRFGTLVIDYFFAVGAAWLFILNVLYKAVTPPYRFSLIIQQLYVIGAQSVAVVALVGVFTGAVLAVQGEYTLAQFGATAYTGSAIALSLIRELGPVLTALMVNGRAGSAMTAELGIMKITEQVDALRSMAVDPIRYLMVPRIIAGLISVPLLTAIFNVVGIAGGYIVGVENLGLSSGTFMSQMIQAVKDVDIISGFVKSVVFGFTFSWVACYKGWTCGFGAVGVNRATTSAVVTSAVAILVLDYFLTSILTNIFM